MTKVFVLREFDKQKVNPAGANFILRRHARTEREDRVSVDLLNLKTLADPVDLDLAYIASSLFLCEILQRTVKIRLNEWICFLVSEIDVWNKSHVKYLLQDILSFMIGRRPSIRFKEASGKNKFDITTRTPESKGVKSVTLFSGGIDSLSGILNVQATYGSTAGVFVSHVNLGRVVDKLMNDFLQKYAIQSYRVNVQSQKAVLQQLRGFLYLSFGAISAKLLKTNKVFISEIGPIMYQPPFVPTDEVTLTTHPSLVKMSKELFREVYGVNFEFYEPFENLTKAEVIASCPEKEAIRFTNSCISTRFLYSDYSHCGRCYGCLVRRISCLVAGVKDAKYGIDILVRGIGERKKGGWRGRGYEIRESDFKDLYVLLRFARDILENKLPDFTASKIIEFKKEELKIRFRYFCWTLHPL
ncbi:MAG: hypothetical protein QXI11_03300 [Thermoproteota archaeon]